MIVLTGGWDLHPGPLTSATRCADDYSMAVESEVESPTIKITRNCTKCGYNLYSLPRQGSCPECGRAYKSRKQDAITKNPRRQLGQLRRMLQRNEHTLRWVPAWWAVAGLVVTMCYFLHARRGWVLAIITVLVAAGRHAAAALNRSDLKQRIESIDANANSK